MTLTRRLTLALTLIGCAVLMASALLETWLDLQRAKDESQEEHKLLGRVLNGAVARAARFEGTEQALFHLDEANRYQQRVHVRWVWLDAPLGSSFTPLLPADSLEPVREGHELFIELDTPGAPTFVSYSPLALEGRHGAIELTGTLGARQEYLQRSAMLVAGSTAALALLFFLATTAIGRQLVGKPVAALSQFAERVGKGDLDARVDLDRPEELKRLAAVLNEMVASLQRARAELVGGSQQRLKMLEQLRHSERLNTVGKLAAGVAHELGTPLAVISLQAKSIAKGEEDLAQSRAGAQLIAQQTETMTRIIRQLLDFARRKTPERQQQPLEPIVTTSVEVLRPVAQQKQVELVFRASGAHVVEADATQLQQVIANLVLNAVQATARGGRVTLEVMATEATPPPDLGGEQGRWLQLTVTDTGSGIAPEDLARVFEPFFTTKEVGEGTGLGLSVSWGLVRDHGGWMTASSEPGKGATFCVFLPVGASS